MPMNQRTKFHCSRSFFGGHIDVFMRSRSSEGRIVVPEPVVLKVCEEDVFTSTPLPFLSLEPEAAQNLMDELWNAGLRPTEGTGSAGSLAATERHLADMRALVFKTEPK